MLKYRKYAPPVDATRSLMFKILYLGILKGKKSPHQNPGYLNLMTI